MSRHIETWIVPAYGKLTASSRVRCTYDEGKLIFCCRVMSDVEHIFIQGRPQIDLLVVVPWPQGGTPARWFAVKRGLRVWPCCGVTWRPRALTSRDCGL